MRHIIGLKLPHKFEHNSWLRKNIKPKPESVYCDPLRYSVRDMNSATGLYHI